MHVRAVHRFVSRLAWVSALALSLFAAPALAQIGWMDGDGGLHSQRAIDIDTLVAEIDKDFTEAQTNDCLTACRALGSMRRAADRLCALEPGERCVGAERKVKAASERVRTACPECGAALLDEKSADRALAPAPPPNDAPASPTVASERARGGCAGCATSGSRESPATPFALAALLGLAVVRRRRRS